MKKKEPETRRPYMSTNDCKSLLILHINDSTDDQVLLQAAAMHAKAPIEWHVAETAQRGISYLRSLIALSHEHEPRWVDLILVDIILPDGSGFEVLKYVRDTPELRPVPVVVLTGHPDPAHQKKADELGVNALHQKPLRFEDCVALVRNLYAHWSTASRRTG